MRERRLAPTSGISYADGPLFLAGKRGSAAKRASMTDQALVGTVLVIGGGIYVAIFAWITQARVRALGPDTKPDHGGH